MEPKHGERLHRLSHGISRTARWPREKTGLMRLRPRVAGTQGYGRRMNLIIILIVLALLFGGGGFYMGPGVGYYGGGGLSLLLIIVVVYLLVTRRA